MLIIIFLSCSQVSPPDEHGFCSLGTSVDIVRSAISNSKVIIGKKGISLIFGSNKFVTVENALYFIIEGNGVRIFT